MTSDRLPCTGRSSLYDIVLFDDAPSNERLQAVHQAAALCASCLSPCADRVTVDSQPRELALLPSGWMPAPTEGVPTPEPVVFRKPRKKQTEVDVGSSYVHPDERTAAWAAMAAERAGLGRSVAEIALDLCVSEDTAAQLIQLSQDTQRRQPAA